MMIKKGIIPLVLFLLSAPMYAQKPRCKKFKTGTFVIPATDGALGSTLKRSDAIQVESISNTEPMLLDIKWVDDCNYILTINASIPTSRVSVLERKIDEEGGLHIEMLRTVKDTMFFRAKAKINGIEYPIDGYQIKISKSFD